MDTILGNLLVSGYAEAAAAPVDITALLCVARERDLYLPERLYHKVPLVGRLPAPEERLAEAVAWIRERAARHRVLVFSSVGARRAPSVVVAYLCLHLEMDFDAAAGRVAAAHAGTDLLPGLEASVRALRGRAAGAWKTPERGRGFPPLGPL